MKKYFNNNESEIINALKNAGFTTSANEGVTINVHGKILVGSTKFEELSYYNQFAAIRSDKRLVKAFLNNESNAAVTNEAALNVMRDFLHGDYNNTLRDDIEQFCGNCKLEGRVTVTGGYDSDGLIAFGFVSIDGVDGEIISGEDIQNLVNLASLRNYKIQRAI